VQDAVSRELAEAEEPLGAREVRASVERVLEGAVSLSSVKNCLARHSIGDVALFERVARGRYRRSLR